MAIGAKQYGRLAQLEERLVYTEEVGSSNLSSPTNLRRTTPKYRPSPLNKIQVPILATIVTAYRFVWQERRDFINFALIPVLLLAILSTAVAATLVDDRAAANVQSFPPSFVLIIAVTTLPLMTLFAVLWHRRFLLPHENPTIYDAFRWRMRHSRCLFVLIATVFVADLAAVGAIFIAAAVGAPQALIFVAGFVAAGLTFARLSMLLPAAATDTLIDFNQAWALARRNAARIFATLLSGVPFVFVGLMISLALSALFGSGASIIGVFVISFVNEFFSFGAVAVVVTVMSEAYRILSASGANLNPMQGPRGT